MPVGIKEGVINLNLAVPAQLRQVFCKEISQAWFFGGQSQFYIETHLRSAEPKDQP
jgi:hypothetical protein